jgi:hypothetical protein
LATCQILDANSAGKHAANLAFDDTAKTGPNTIGWKPIPRVFSDKDSAVEYHPFEHQKTDR